MKHKIKTTIKSIIILFSLAVLGSAFYNLTDVFIDAYLSPTKTAMVDINSVGEATVELWGLLLSIPLIFISLKWIVDMLVANETKNQKQFSRNKVL